ncbi:MAG TPA: galactokinase [Candidatus Enterocloster faecavium]|uniref:Galactokinase n=1 Tax=Candidatus Enterocloster faecavium TaxID=2838560 RepID=A0A9D2L948_9FIRM|nr:galactokinase [Candidatus Enterocloster faecavium]
MGNISALRKELENGGLDERLCRLGCLDPAQVPETARERVRRVVAGFQAVFQKGEDAQAALLSAPGRTEICGNHTDHQRGRVLAASVNLDFLACASANGSQVIRFQSEGWPMVEVDLGLKSIPEEEKETTASLVRGVAAKIQDMGYKVEGFDAYAVSDVLPGSGLSSSAACEVLLGVIVNHLFCHDELNAVQIAQIGQFAENVYFGKPSGLMDQMASSVGGAVAIDFRDKEDPKVTPMAVNLEKEGYALCIVDSGADHADLTSEYAAIPQEMKAVAAFFGKEVLSQVEEEEVLDHLPEIRREAGDRAVLRALHFYADDKRVALESQALENGDFARFLELVKESGRSSWMYLQNINPAGAVKHQEMAIALAAAEVALKGRGASRVHGGGFAGTIQAFVPLELLDSFKSQMESMLGAGCCHVLSIRPEGGAVIWP